MRRRHEKWCVSSIKAVRLTVAHTHDGHHSNTPVRATALTSHASVCVKTLLMRTKTPPQPTSTLILPLQVLPMTLRRFGMATSPLTRTTVAHTWGMSERTWVVWLRTSTVTKATASSFTPPFRVHRVATSVCGLTTAKASQPISLNSLLGTVDASATFGHNRMKYWVKTCTLRPCRLTKMADHSHLSLPCVSL